MKPLSYGQLVDTINNIEGYIRNSETRDHGHWPERLDELKAEKAERDAAQAEDRLHRESIMKPAECIEFLREEALDACPVSAENFKRCADCLESLWNASQQRVDDQEDWLMQQRGNQ
jgi:hypothetical protein